MRTDFYIENIGKLIKQRNTSLVFASLILITNILLGAKLLFHSDRIVIVPPEIRKEFWIEGARASSTYLEQMSLYFAKQMLDMTPETAGEIRTTILRHVSSDYYATLSQKLIEQEQYLKEHSITTVFFPKSVRVDEKHKLAKVTGQIKQMVGKEITKEEEHTYMLKYQYDGVRFLISSFVKVKD